MSDLDQTPPRMTTTWKVESDWPVDGTVSRRAWHITAESYTISPDMMLVFVHPSGEQVHIAPGCWVSIAQVDGAMMQDPETTA